MQSIWSAGFAFPKRKPLEESVTADVCVIGAGMAGLLTAFLLKERGIRAVVLDSGVIAGGVTRNTTGKVTVQHNLIYDRLISRLGREQAAQYARTNQRALDKYRELVEKRGISCHWEDKPSYVYSRTELEPLRAEAEAARSLGLPAELTERLDLPFQVRGAVRFERQAQFHPLEFLQDVVRELTVYEHSAVRGIENGTAVTETGRVRAGHIVVATHFPFVNTPGYYFLRLHQQRSYIIAVQGAKPLEGMYIDADPDGFSLRTFENYLLLGGAGHRAGENGNGGRYDRLRTAAAQFYPGARERYRWSAQDCMTPDLVPYIGEYGEDTPNLLVATGFNKWGMTGSMAAALLLSGRIAGEEQPDGEVFSPRRFQVSADMLNILTDGMHTASGLLSRLFEIPNQAAADLPLGAGGIVSYKTEKAGAYKDGEGNVTFVSAQCPHMGCQLTWNPDERSWDCPCHGSRFDWEGRRLDGPAQDDLESRCRKKETE